MGVPATLQQWQGRSGTSFQSWQTPLCSSISSIYNLRCLGNSGPGGKRAGGFVYSRSVLLLSQQRFGLQMKSTFRKESSIAFSGFALNYVQRRSRSKFSFLTKGRVTGIISDSTHLETEKGGPGQPGELCGKSLKGWPLPFGPTAFEGGVNFSVHSSGATAVSLCLYTESDLQKGEISKEISLHPVFNRTGNVWHIFLSNVTSNLLYGYRVDGRYNLEEGICYNPRSVLVDPYARAVISKGIYGHLGHNGTCWPQMAGMVPQESDDQFDWDGDLPLRHKQKDLIIYEIHVRGFTRHSSSAVNYPGTYLGLVEKLSHLKFYENPLVRTSAIMSFVEI